MTDKVELDIETKEFINNITQAANALDSFLKKLKQIKNLGDVGGDAEKLAKALSSSNREQLKSEVDSVKQANRLKLESTKSRLKEEAETAKINAKLHSSLEKEKVKLSKETSIAQLRIDREKTTSANRNSRELLQINSDAAKQKIQIAAEEARLQNINIKNAIASQRLYSNEVNKTARDVLISWQSIERIMYVNVVRRMFMALVESIKMATNEIQQFHSTITRIETIAGRGEKAFHGWSKAILDVSNAWGSGLKDTSEGVYEIMSNQITKNIEGTKKMADSIFEFAKITGSSGKSSVDLITGSLNAYNRSTTEVEQTSANLFKAIDLGRITATELGGSYGRVAVQAHQLGISEEELLGSLSRISIQGIKASETMTLFRGVTMKLLRPTEEMEKLFKKIGVTSGEELIQIHGFTGALKILYEETKGSASEIADLFTMIRPSIGMTALLNDLQKTTETISQFGKTALKSYKEAQEIQFQSPGEQLSRHLNAVKNSFTVGFGENIARLLIGIGNALGGVTTKAADGSVELNGLSKTIITLTKYATSAAVVLGSMFVFNRASKAWSAFVLNATTQISDLGVRATSVNAKMDLLKATIGGIGKGLIFAGVTIGIEQIIEKYLDLQRIQEEIKERNRELRKLFGQELSIKIDSTALQNFEKTISNSKRSMADITSVTENMSESFNKLQTFYNKENAGLYSSTEEAFRNTKNNIEDLFNFGLDKIRELKGELKSYENWYTNNALNSRKRLAEVESERAEGMEKVLLLQKQLAQAEQDAQKTTDPKMHMEYIELSKKLAEDLYRTQLKVRKEFQQEEKKMSAEDNKALKEEIKSLEQEYRSLNHEKSKIASSRRLSSTEKENMISDINKEQEAVKKAIEEATQQRGKYDPRANARIKNTLLGLSDDDIFKAFKDNLAKIDAIVNNAKPEIERFYNEYIKNFGDALQNMGTEFNNALAKMPLDIAEKIGKIGFESLNQALNKSGSMEEVLKKALDVNTVHTFTESLDPVIEKFKKMSDGLENISKWMEALKEVNDQLKTSREKSDELLKQKNSIEGRKSKYETDISNIQLLKDKLITELKQFEKNGLFSGFRGLAEYSGAYNIDSNPINKISNFIQELNSSNPDNIVKTLESIKDFIMTLSTSTRKLLTDSGVTNEYADAGISNMQANTKAGRENILFQANDLINQTSKLKIEKQQIDQIVSVLSTNEAIIAKDNAQLQTIATATKDSLNPLVDEMLKVFGSKGTISTEDYENAMNKLILDMPKMDEMVIQTSTKFITATEGLDTVTGNLTKLAGSTVKLIDIIESKIKDQETVNSMRGAPDWSGERSGKVKYFRKGFSAIGSDTVPAMLAPGEAVINREATRKMFAQLVPLNNSNQVPQSVNQQSVNVGNVNINLQNKYSGMASAQDIATSIGAAIRRGAVKWN